MFAEDIASILDFFVIDNIVSEAVIGKTLMHINQSNSANRKKLRQVTKNDLLHATTQKKVKLEKNTERGSNNKD